MKSAKKLMEEAVFQWGEETQLNMVIEECAELIDAIQKRRRGRVTWEKLVEEGVDVELCIEQLKLILDEPVEWQKVRQEKLARLSGLLRSVR